MLREIQRLSSPEVANKILIGINKDKREVHVIRSVERILESTVIVLHVQSKDRALAEDYARTWAEVYLNETNHSQGWQASLLEAVIVEP